MSKKRSKKIEEPIKENPTNKEDNQQLEDKSDVDELQLEKEKFLRLFAEFENYKKRTARERIELFTTASEEVMTSLLSILDDFDRAGAEIEKNQDNEIFKGVILIQNKFKDILISKGLTLIEVKKGDKFNADNHEAVSQIDAPNAKLKGRIIEVIEKGYKLGEKIIRYPKVVIGK